MLCRAPVVDNTGAQWTHRAANRQQEHRVTTATDEYYRDIIEGLAIHSGSAFQSDVLATVSRHHERDLGAAFNKNQMASKLWLRESLLEAGGPAYANVT